MRLTSLTAGLGLATASGCLWFLACAPFNLAPLAWVASLPMLFVIDRAPTVRRALLLGWWAGVVETAGGFYWIIDLAKRFAGFPWIGGAGVLALFCALRALIFLLFTAVVVRVRRRRAVPMALIAPLAMAASEYLVPQVFPCGQWISQAWHPLLIQIADVTGPYSVTALLLMVSGALYDAATAFSATRTLSTRAFFVPLGAAAAVLIAVLCYGALRMHAIDARRAAAPQLAIGLVQPNFAYRSDGELSAQEAERQLDALEAESLKLERAGAELIVWSEGAYPLALPHTLSIDFPPDSPARLRRDLSVPLLAGVTTYDAKRDEFFNSALAIDPNGTVTGRYDKVELLAFGEYIPGVELFPWLRQVLPAGAGGYTRGAGAVALSVSPRFGPRWSLGPLICYEDILAEYIRKVGALHPDLLVNLTVDSWYGARTEPWQHLALAVFASIEVRTDLVRAVNSGISALIDANGRVRAATPPEDPYLRPLPAVGLLVTAARLAGGDTLYVRFGEWFVFACIAGCIALLLAPRRPAR